MESNDGKTIARLMKQVNIKLNKNIRSNFSDCGFTIPQMTVLMLLKENGEMRISEISSRMGLSNSTVSGIIDRLERMGLVRRIRNDQDRRVVKVELARGMNELYHDFDSRMENYFNELFSRVSGEDLGEIIRGLEKFNEILNNICDGVEGE